VALVTISRCIAFGLQPEAAELGGQPVEQLRVRGRLALGPEVVVGRDQPAPEVGLPDPVDRHPRRQRVVVPEQPIRQVHPVRRSVGRFQGGQDRRHARRDLRARPGEVAAVEEVRLPRVRSTLADDHRRDELRGPGPDRGDRLLVCPGRGRLVEERLEGDAVPGGIAPVEREVDRLADRLGLLLAGGHVEALLPGPLRLQDRGFLLDEPVDVGLRAGLEGVTLGDLLGRGDGDLGLVAVIEEGEMLVVFFLRDWIILVVVALAAAHRQAEEGVAVVFARSMIDSTRNCSRSMPPS
jgi:hypothetical protein